jgi:hypothetical protein
MTQLELFDEQSEEDFAMSLTSAQFAGLKHSNPEAHHWIGQIRRAVKEYEFKVNRLKLLYEEQIYRAKHGRSKEHYQLDRFPGW